MIIKKDKSEIESFFIDAANYKGDCSAVFFPECEADIIKIVKEANSKKEKITIAGNGTGLTGARVPEGGIVISMSKMNKVIEINSQDNYAIVQPAVVLRNFQEVVLKNRMLYPPDPTEQDCFIGATIATNSSGAKSFKYGATRNYVLELQIVLPTGDVVKLKRGENFAVEKKLKLTTQNGFVINIDLPNYNIPNVKHTAGYYTKPNMDAIDLFIGSEGTLGIITEAKLKLLEETENLISGILFFVDESKSLDFVDDARTESIKHRTTKDKIEINARGLEFFDYYSLQFLKDDYQQINNNYQAAIWFEQETTCGTEDELLEKWMHLMEKHSADIENSWFAVDNNELEKFKRFRHAISSKVSEFIAQKGLRKVGTDTAVPINSFRKYYKEMKTCVTEAGLNYICYGHIGDCHLHLNMLPQNENELIIAKNLYKTLCNSAVKYGGTISAEHGIGKMKRDYLVDMYGEKNIREMAKIKKALDPNMVLGIGNIFDEKFLYEL